MRGVPKKRADLLGRPSCLKICWLENEANAKAHGASVLEEERQAVSAVGDQSTLGSRFGSHVVARQELLNICSQRAVVRKFQVLVAATKRIRIDGKNSVLVQKVNCAEFEGQPHGFVRLAHLERVAEAEVSLGQQRHAGMVVHTAYSEHAGSRILAEGSPSSALIIELASRRTVDHSYAGRLWRALRHG